MNCFKCGAEVGQNSVLCPRCHERIPNRHLSDVAKNSLHYSKDRKSDGQDSEQKHHWVNMVVGLLVLCTAGFVCIKLGGDLAGTIKNTTLQTMADSKERLEDVCHQGFKKFSSAEGMNADEFQQSLDEYAKENGFVNTEMFFAACGQFAGKLAQDLFKYPQDSTKFSGFDTD